MHATLSMPVDSLRGIFCSAERIQSVAICCGSQTAVTAFRGICLFLHQITSNRIIFRLGADLQTTAFRHLIGADYARFAREGTGHMVSRLTNDIGIVQAASQATLNTVLRDTMTVIGLLATMLYLDPILSLIVLGVFPIAILPSRSSW